MDHAQERKNLSPSHTDVPAVGRAAHAEATLEEAAAIHGPICRSVTPVLNRVGDKWSMLLSNGPKRFSELKRAIDGISQRMLTLSLRNLERDGLISRHVTPSIPPRVDYELTELGISLREPVQGLGTWAMAHIDCIRAAQQRYDAALDDVA